MFYCFSAITKNSLLLVHLDDLLAFVYRSRNSGRANSMITGDSRSGVI